ncbi:hypothetical protein B0H67DRAFT_648685 [Lasiosphaeris hirsuta]|uniref:Uncharacterized protein n=1 Tax=Lasiosphaeris hirsuta TaxID=260670 RepID=A0AA40DPP8_9PEZI|nr:hypothetical protein B0H67DRAFT_648685 [Lasiosphaeris hirsuta]
MLSAMLDTMMARSAALLVCLLHVGGGAALSIPTIGNGPQRISCAFTAVADHLASAAMARNFAALDASATAARWPFVASFPTAAKSLAAWTCGWCGTSDVHCVGPNRWALCQEGFGKCEVIRSTEKLGKCTNSVGVMSLNEVKDLIRDKGLTPRLLPGAMMKELVWDDQWIGYDDEGTIAP